MNVIRVIATVIIPPLGVFLKRGLGWPFLLSIVLTLLAYIPGLVYALFIVLGEEEEVALGRIVSWRGIRVIDR